MEGAHTAYFKLMRFFVEKLGGKTGKVIPEYQEKFQEYINDDLDTAKAIALLHEIMKDEKNTKADIRATFLDFDKVLAFGFSDANAKRLENISGEKKLKVDEIPDDIQDLLNRRESARKDKNFNLADSLRAEIEEKGYEIVDSPEGATVKKKS
jgi:cysteinyl-tRNA synthetase